MWKEPENPFGEKGLCTQVGINGKQEIGDAIPIKGFFLPMPYIGGRLPHRSLWDSSLATGYLL
jgi:hypothetical protein